MDFACCCVDSDGNLALMTSQGVVIERLGVETAAG